MIHGVAAWYLGVILLIALERLAELIVARRNAAWSLSRGAVERGQGHYPVMVALHSGLLLGCVIEAGARPEPPLALAVPGLALAIACQGVRWWVIRTLGPRWNTRILILPGLPRVSIGPFRWFSHPNYAAVITEGAALPGMYGCWVTALTFSVLNAALLGVRIRAENAALAERERPDAAARGPAPLGPTG